jgi:N-carbamoylputrescine amidase
MSCAEDPAVNMETAVAGIRQCAAEGAQLVCLPELFRSRYFCQQEDAAAFDLAEPIPGPSSEELSELAKELGLVILGPVFERRAAGVYHNALLVLGPDGSTLGHYRKMHIPDDPAYYEKFYFTPGDLGFRVFKTPLGPVGTLICWDQWFPEAARLLALQGAPVIFYPTAIGWLPAEKEQSGKQQLDAWQTIQRSHAIANGVYVVAVNRVGHEPGPTGGIDFWGSSFVCDPMGEILQQASDNAPGVLTVELDPGRVDTVRREWPFLRDRRIDAYDGISFRHID